MCLLRSKYMKVRSEVVNWNCGFPHPLAAKVLVRTRVGRRIYRDMANNRGGRGGGAAEEGGPLRLDAPRRANRQVSRAHTSDMCGLHTKWFAIRRTPVPVYCHVFCSDNSACYFWYTLHLALMARPCAERTGCAIEPD